jgi:hypothetical protein
MPSVVTSNATILCAHGGRVTLIPRRVHVLAGGAAVLCEPVLAGAPIAIVPSIPVSWPSRAEIRLFSRRRLTYTRTTGA